MRFPLVLLVATIGSAQTYTIHTFAGGGPPENTLCTTADVFESSAIAADSAGNLFLAVPRNGTVVRCDATTHVLTRVAGTGVNGFSSAENLPALNVRMSSPVGLAVDSAGNLYIAEAGRVRKVSNGISSTVAGIGVAGYGGDGGPATSAQVDPAGIAVDASGNLYIADGFTPDLFNWRVRKVSNGIITTIAGSGNGSRASNTIPPPVAVAVDASANVYFADNLGFVYRIIDGATSLVAGMSGTALAADSAGNVYAAGINGVQKLSGGAVTTLLQTASAGIAVDGAGNIYFTDTSTYVQNRSGNSVRQIHNGSVAAVVTGYKNADRGSSAFSQFATPYGLAVDALDNLYFSDQAMHRVREISGGMVNTVAGNGTPGFGGDGGPASAAQLLSPTGIAVDAAGAVYIADSGNNRIRKVTGGVITTVAGTGVAGFGGDGGPAAAAELSNPVAVAVDTAGALYIADLGNNRVRKVSNGVITTAAGNGEPGYLGDNGPAPNAQLRNPVGVAVDGAGNLYIADLGNGFIRKVSPNGIINTVAGAGHATGNGIPAASAGISPNVLAVDAAGNIYIGESFPYTGDVRRVKDGLIDTIAGANNYFFSTTGGPATAIALPPLNGLAVDSAGKVYIADTASQTIRVLFPFGSAPITIDHVLNAATNEEVSIAPGEVITITGSNLGPARLTMGQLTSDGVYDTQIAGSSVQVNGVPAPMIYTSANQIAAVVPYRATFVECQVTVSYQGQESAPHIMGGLPVQPGIFTVDASGRGQAAAINQDGTVNGPSHPAPPGSIVSLYATGWGVTVPSGIDGKPNAAPLPKPYGPTVSAVVGGVSIYPVSYAGGAPGEIAGMMQVNLQIPANVTPGNAVGVAISLLGAMSQPGVTIAVGPAVTPQ